MPADEFAQYKVGVPAAQVDEFAQYKAAPTQPTTIGVNRDTPPAGSSGYQYSTGYQGPNDQPRDSGGFIDRMTTAAGRALQNPMNFVPSWKDVVAPGLAATQQSYQEFKDYLSGAPVEDPAKRIGNMMPAALTALVTHAADAAPNLANVAKSEFAPGIVHPIQSLQRGTFADVPIYPKEIASRVPIWQRPGTTTTPTEPGFNWQGSTPQEIQAHLSQMANRVKPSRMEGQPADIPAQSPGYEVQRIPAGVKNTKASTVDPYQNQSMPPMTKAYSSTVEAYHYDPFTQTQIIHFKSGDIYRVRGVPPEVHQQFTESPSMGSFHAENIKGRYETTKIGKTTPSRTRGAQVSQALSQNQPQLYRPESDAAFNRMNPPEDIPDTWGLDLSGSQEQTGPDIGAKVRAKMPPLPRGGK